MDHGGQGLYSLQVSQIQESTWEEAGQSHRAKLVDMYTCSNPTLALCQVNQGCSQPLLPPAGCPEESWSRALSKGGRRLQRRDPALPLGHAQEIHRKGPGASSLAWSFSEGAAAKHILPCLHLQTPQGRWELANNSRASSPQEKYPIVLPLPVTLS